MSGQKRWILFFTGCFIFGCLGGSTLPWLIMKSEGTYDMLLKNLALPEMDYQKTEPFLLFPYIVRIRCGGIFLLWMSCYTPLAVLMHSLCLIGTGMSGGLLLAMFLLKNGEDGILYFLCCILPQWILYFVVLMRELRFLTEKRRNRKVTGCERKRNTVYEIQELLLQIGICICGCAVETLFGLRIVPVFQRYL